jgi:predicted nucleic acid-binding protein
MPPPSLFADTFYWIALVFPRDAFHAAVVSFSRTLGSVRLVTTDEVFTEVLNHFAGLGPYWRGKAAALVHDLRSDPDVDVLPQTRTDFDAALALYETRPDKGYSLTDCRSMLAMKNLTLTEALVVSYWRCTAAGRDNHSLRVQT